MKTEARRHRLLTAQPTITRKISVVTRRNVWYIYKCVTLIHNPTDTTLVANSLLHTLILGRIVVRFMGHQPHRIGGKQP